jgi:hypothetical protein
MTAELILQSESSRISAKDKTAPAKFEEDLADYASLAWERLEEIARLRRLLLAGPETARRLLPPEL